MLTFEFTGVEGSMTVSDVLTSGMVGREVCLKFDESWVALNKTVVFQAGDITRTQTLSAVSGITTIPEDVLRHPFCRLYVGVWGKNTDDVEVIPTIMAEGPFIRYGADPTADPEGTEVPVWKDIQNQIGDLSQLETENAQDLVDAINEALEKGGGLSPEAAALLIAILRQGTYSTDQTENITQLETLLGCSADEEDGSGDTGGDDTGEEGGDSEEGGADATPCTHSVIRNLTNVTTANTATAVADDFIFVSRLIPDPGYALGSVLVIMGSKNITKNVYADGMITIDSVTADLLITANAYPLTPAASETLSLVSVYCEPRMDTFAYTEWPNDDVTLYTIAKESTIRGGVISVDYDVNVCNGWDLNLYIFDEDGNPKGWTNRACGEYHSDGVYEFDRYYFWGATPMPGWERPANGEPWTGFGTVLAPFRVQIPEGCTVMACMRYGARAPYKDNVIVTDGYRFSEWLLRGGVTFTVTKYE